MSQAPTKRMSSAESMVGIFLFEALLVLVYYLSEQDLKTRARVAHIFLIGLNEKAICVAKQEQNAKFSAITRHDYVRHVCADGSSAQRETSNKTVVYTYQMVFANLNTDVKKIAGEQGCVAVLKS